MQTNWGPCIAAQAGVVPIVYGIPGHAKTSIFKAIAKKAGVRFIHETLSNRMPEDLGGIPEKSTVFIDGVFYECIKTVLPEMMVRAAHEPCVLLLDELNQTPHSVLAAAQEWFNHPPANCWMFAASNRPEHSTAGQQLPPPVVNRMVVFDWVTPTDAILEGWANGKKWSDYPPPDVPLLPDNWEDEKETWGPLFSEFGKTFPDLIGQDAFPKDIDKATEPWPSPRSWENAGRLMAACDAVGANTSTRKQCVYGCVGEAAAKTFLTWLREQDLPDPEDILANPSSLKLPNRFDIARAIVSSVRGRIEANPTPERWEAGQDVIEVVYPQHAELGVTLFARLQPLRPSGHTPAPRNGVFAEIHRLMTDLV